MSRAFNVNDTTNLDLEHDEIEAHVNLIQESLNISPVNLSKFQDLISTDEEMKALIKYIVGNKWPNHKRELPLSIRQYWCVKDELTYCNNLIFKGSAIVIPPSVRQEMLKRLHYPHLGVIRTQLRAKNVMYWPLINHHIEDLVSRCEICALNAKNNFKEPLLPHPVPRLPWQKIGIDILFLDGKPFLLLVDYFSKYVELVTLQNMTSTFVVNHL